MAWISSTITVRTGRSSSRPRSLVSRMYSDSGVVTRMCGGWRIMAARSAEGVSPVRSSTRMRGLGRPRSRKLPAMPASGSCRFFCTSALSALSGET